MKNKLIELGNEVFNNYIGYKPDSSSIKPVHIANGLFRLILNESYSIDALNNWIIRWRQGEEINPSSNIRERYGHILDDNSFDDDEINRLRYYLNIIFNADNAATPSTNNSVLTISSKTQVRSGVQWEANMHKFIHNLLSAKINGESSPCIQLIKDCLLNENDDLSRLAAPLTNEAKKISIQPNGTDHFNMGPVEFRLREAFDLLSQNEKMSSQSKLLTLERIILLSCFSIIVHLTSKILDLSPNYTSYERIPMLFDADGTLESVKFASEETLSIARQMIEAYFEECLKKVLAAQGYDEFTHEQMLERIDETPMPDSSKKTSNLRNEDDKRAGYKALYLGYFDQCKDPFEAIVKATRFRLFADEYNTDPSKFMINFGGRIALYAPRAQGGRRKRYSPDPLLLEIILLSTLKSETTLTLSEFGALLWKQFGIIIGANPEEDIQRLARWKISQITPGDLSGELSKNAEKIANMYISMGYGKRYADGVTVIYLRR